MIEETARERERKREHLSNLIGARVLFLEREEYE